MIYGKTKNICKTLSRAGHYRRGVAGRVYHRCFSEMLKPPESDWKPFRVVFLMLAAILISTILGISFYVFR